MFNVLSLFDGISCGQIALNRAGIKYDNYFASEIDKNAIKVTQHNYPATIQLGDITKWREWNLPQIDLICAGSPCQGFSFAGKQLNFEDARSKLFFVFVEILEDIRSRNSNILFLLENVRMKKEYQNEITRILGVEAIEINSSLVSAQNRRRLFWYNIPNVDQPNDKNIYLKDVLEEHPDVKYYCSGKHLDWIIKNLPTEIQHKPTPNYRGHFIFTLPHGYLKSSIKYYEKCPTITYQDWGTKYKLTDLKGNFRKLTPEECEKLQTIEPGYTNVISDAQRYKALGNGWTVDVIAHIFKNIEP